MRAMSIAAIVTGLIATAPMSAAADQTVTQSFSVTIPASVASEVPDFNTTPFSLFDPTFGTLESVNVTLSGSISVVSSDPSPLVFLLLANTLPNGNFDVLGMGTFPSGTKNLMFSSGDADLPIYIGTGDGAFLVQAASETASPSDALVESNGPLIGAITYTFTPPTLTLAVPETPTWAAMLIGFGCLGFAAYRTTRTSVAV